MRRRIVRAVCVLVLLGIVGIAMLACYFPEPRIGRTGFSRLKGGMTYEQVVDLLGPQNFEQPGGGLRRKYEDEEVLFGSGKEDVEITKEWRGKGRTISVWFSAEGRVIGAHYLRFEESIFESFRRWVGLKVH